MELHVNLRQNITLIYTLFANISQCSGFNDVPDNELLDGLVLGHASRTVGTSEEFDVATAVLVTSSITPLLGHCGYLGRFKELEFT